MTRLISGLLNAQPRRLALILLCLSALGAGRASAQSPGPYIIDLIAKDPQLLRNWQSAVPSELESIDWLFQMQAVTTPVETVTLDGSAHYLGWMCQPHDCGDNQAYFVIAKQGRVAAGFLTSVNEAIAGRYFGSQSATLLDALLTRCLKDGDKAFACADAR